MSPDLIMRRTYLGEKKREDNEENTEGVRCVAAPILDYTGQPIAAISISGHVGQITVKRFPELGNLARRAADDVSRRLGYQG